MIFRDFTLLNNPVYGNCYVFNSGWNKSQPLKHASQSGRTHGLSSNICACNFASTVKANSAICLSLTSVKSYSS